MCRQHDADEPGLLLDFSDFEHLRIPFVVMADLPPDVVVMVPARHFDETAAEHIARCGIIVGVEPA